VAGRGGVYTTHMRNEGSDILAALAEAFEVGRRSGVRLQISHLKLRGDGLSALREKALDSVRAACADIDVAADAYPYEASWTSLDVVLPDWACEGGCDATLARLRDPSDRARIRQYLLRPASDARSPTARWATVMVAATVHPGNERFRGMRIPQVAEALGTDSVDAVLHLLLTDELGTGAVFFVLTADDVRAVLAEPYVMVGSDASLRSTEGPLSRDHPHPRAYGTFPKFLRMAIDGQTVALPEAVRKMTSLPAERFGLHDRGRIAPGKAADVVVLDPSAVRDCATYVAPHRYADGIEAVVVNGQPAWLNRRYGDTRSGRVL